MDQLSAISYVSKLWCTKRWHCFCTAFTYISTYICNFSDWVWKKFNLVLYGIKECPKGTPRHSRLVSDLKSVADILSSIDTQVSQLSIRDNYQLGKYQPNRSGPILVKMTRSSEVSSILSNRHKLTSQPGIFIKADLSPKERLIESLLLKERRSLIELGVDRSGIKIRGNALYVKKQKHASVINSVLNLANPQHPIHLVPPDDTISVNDKNSSPSPDIPEPRTPPHALSKTSVQSSSQSWLYGLGLVAGTWNARSVVNKLHFLQSLIYCKSLDVFCITETWLTDFVINNEIAPEHLSPW